MQVQVHGVAVRRRLPLLYALRPHAAAGECVSWPPIHLVRSVPTCPPATYPPAHLPLQHFSLFNRDVVNPIKKFGYVGAGRKAFTCLKKDVLEVCLLRRTKASRADEMVLPPKLITIEANFLDAKESDFYQALYTQSKAKFGAYIAAGTLLNNYAHILDLLTRLRQVRAGC